MSSWCLRRQPELSSPTRRVLPAVARLWVPLCLALLLGAFGAHSQTQGQHGDYVCTEMMKASMQTMFVSQDSARVAEDTGDLCDLCCKITRKAFFYRNDPAYEASWSRAVRTSACVYSELGRAADCKILSSAILDSQEVFFLSPAAEIPEAERNTTEKLVLAVSRRARYMCEQMSCCWTEQPTSSPAVAGKATKPSKKSAKPAKKGKATAAPDSSSKSNSLITPGACGNGTATGNGKTGKAGKGGKSNTTNTAACQPPTGSIEQFQSGMSPAEMANMGPEDMLARIQVDKVLVRKDIRLLSHMKDGLETAKHDLSLRAKAVIVREKELDHAFKTGIIHCNAAQYAQMAQEYQVNQTIIAQKLKKEKEEAHKKWCKDHKKDIKCMSASERNKTMTSNSTSRSTIETPSGKVVEDEKEVLPETPEEKRQREEAAKQLAAAANKQPTPVTPQAQQTAASNQSASAQQGTSQQQGGAQQQGPKSTAEPPPNSSQSQTGATQTSTPPSSESGQQQQQAEQQQPKFQEVQGSGGRLQRIVRPASYVAQAPQPSQLAPPLPPGWKWQYKYVYE